MKILRAISLAVLLVGPLCVGPLQSQTKPDKEYLFYVLSEAADKIALVRFGPNGARIDRQIDTGDMPVDIDGPHGIVVSPDRRFYYVSIAHGRPFGTVWKYSTNDDSVVGKTTLGHFPATMDITPDGQFLYVVNFNLHGDMTPSTVSVVSTQTMTEVARIPTCTMPHGSRLNPQGTKQYSACMMDDMLVEIDTRSLKATRHFLVTKNKEGGMAGPPTVHATSHTKPAMKHTGGHGSEAPKPGDTSCSPTWAEPSTDGSSIFVACNGSIYELKSGRELARVPTKRKVLHGVVVSPDDRYAFVTVEGVGTEPGTVEIIDLVTLKTVTTVDVAPGAAGIDLLSR